MKRLFWCLLALLVLCCGAGRAVAGFIVTPGPTQAWNVLPFGPSGDVRYQQVYAASLFGNTGPIEITALAFSSDRDITYTADVAIRFNQTTALVGGLSANLDDNVTGSLTPIFHDPLFSLAVLGGDLTYNLRFNLSPNPFIYDPSTGDNLLVDFLISDAAVNGNRGAAFARGGDTGVTSRAMESSVVGLAGPPDGLGLRTLIEFRPADVAPVPEPSTFAIWGSGFAAVVMVRCLRRRKPQ